jgi:hypothetical protein
MKIIRVRHARLTLHSLRETRRLSIQAAGAVLTPFAEQAILHPTILNDLSGAGVLAGDVGAKLELVISGNRYFSTSRYIRTIELRQMRYESAQHLGFLRLNVTGHGMTKFETNKGRATPGLCHVACASALTS